MRLILPTGETATASNLGTGSGVFAQKSGSEFQFKSLVPGASIVLTGDANEITIASAASGAGEANTASNLGAGEGIFASKVGVDLTLKSLVAGTNTSLSSDGTTITITASGGAASGEANTASNIGGAVGVFSAKSGEDLEFRSLLGGSGIIVATSGDLIRFDVHFLDDFNTLQTNFTNASGIFVKDGENLGGGQQVFVQRDTDQNLEFRTLVGGSGVIITTSGNTIRFDNHFLDDFNTLQSDHTQLRTDFDNSSGVFQAGTTTANEVRTDFDNSSGIWIKNADNVGIGSGEVFAQKTGSNLEFRKLLAGSGVTISTSGNTVRIDNNLSDDFSVLETNFTNASGVWVKDGENLGAGSGIFVQKDSENNLEFKTLVAGANVTITGDANTITVATSSGVGEANTASNIGDSIGVFDSKSGVDLRFKSLFPGSGTSIVASGNSIVFHNTLTDDLSILEVDFANASGIWVKNGENLGGEQEVFIQKDSSQNLEFRTLIGSSGIIITTSGSTLRFDSHFLDDFEILQTDFANASGNWVTTASNVGLGTGSIFAQKSGSTLELRKLLQGSGITISTSGNTIRIDNNLEDDLNNLQTDFDNSSGVFVKNAENIGGAQGIFSSKDSEQNLELRSLLGGSGIKVEVSGSIIRIDAHVIDGQNLGAGSGVFVQKDADGNLEFRTLTAGTDIGINQTATELEIYSTSSEEATTASNVGIGSGEVFAQETGNDLEFRRLLGGSGMFISTSGNTVRFDWTHLDDFETLDTNFNDLNTDFTNASGVWVKTASNVGGGANVFKQKSGSDLEFKTFNAGSGISISAGVDNVTISRTDVTVGSGSTTADHVAIHQVGSYDVAVTANIYSPISGLTIADEIQSFTMSESGVARYNGTSLVPFLVSADISAAVSSPNEVVSYRLAKNGETLVESQMDRNINVTADLGSTSLSEIISLSTNDTVQAFCTSDSNTTITIERFTMTCTAIVGGQNNTNSNVGLGTGEVFAQKSGAEMELRRLLQGSGMQITTSGNTIRIDNALEDDFDALNTNFANASGVWVKDGENLGSANEVFIQKDVDENLEFRTLLGSSGIIITTSGNTLRFDSHLLDDFQTLELDFANASGNWVTDASNVGLGTGSVFGQKSGSTLELRKLLQGSGIQIATSGDTIRIDNALEDDFSTLNTDFTNASGVWVKDGQNVGGESEVFVQKDADNNLEFRTLIGSSGIIITTSGNTLRFDNHFLDDFTTLETDFANASGNWVTTASNVGLGTGSIFAQKSGSTLELRKLLQGSGIIVSTSGDTVRIDSALEDDVSINKTNIDNLQTDFTNSSGIFQGGVSTADGVRIDFDNASGIWVKDGENLGGASEVFIQKDTDENLEFRTLIGSSGIIVTTSGNTLRFDNHFLDDFTILETDFGNASGNWVKGNGTTDKMPKWSDTDTVTDSIITELNSKIGISSAAPSGKLEVSGDINTPTSAVELNAGSNTVDLSNSNIFRCDLEGVGATVQFTNQHNGGKYTLFIKQNNGASGTITGWPTTWKWRNSIADPTITATSGKVDIVTFIYDAGDDVYYADIGQNYG